MCVAPCCAALYFLVQAHLGLALSRPQSISFVLTGLFTLQMLSLNYLGLINLSHLLS
jgi:hypothetical protein